MFSLRAQWQPSLRIAAKSGLIPTIHHCLVGVRDQKEAWHLPAVSGEAETQTSAKGSGS